jgi:hypothetical protein
MRTTAAPKPTVVPTIASPKPTAAPTTAAPTRLELQIVVDEPDTTPADPSVDNSCVVAGASIRCPVDASFTLAGDKKLLDASLSCPLDSVSQSNFMVATQKGLCTCAVADDDVAPPVQILGQRPLGTRSGQVNVTVAIANWEGISRKASARDNRKGLK